MIKEVTATGADVNAAIDSGAMLLGTTREEVQFEILSLPKKGGFLGFGKCPAKVRVWIELPDEEKPREAARPTQKPQQKKEERPVRENRGNENKPAPARETRAPKAPTPAAATPAAPAPAPVEYQEPVEIEPTEEVRRKVEKAAAYVKEILACMGLTEVELTPRYFTENVRLQLSGTEIGSVIGRRGETLDSIQYLASLVANRGEGDYIRLSIDSGNYREKRARTLEALARKLAGQAVRTGKSTTLEPMNPYERRIIHGAVSGIKGATSSSIGVEPNRRVVISAIDAPKREGGEVRENRGGNRGGSRGGRGGNNRGPRPEGGENRGYRGGNRGGRSGGSRRMEDPPAIGGPVRREQPAAAPKAEKNELEKEIVSTAKRYGKIDL